LLGAPYQNNLHKDCSNLLNVIYFVYSEKPALVKRFGNDYKKYKEAVPMFIPKFKTKKPRT
jgi:hypothetical protein